MSLNQLWNLDDRALICGLNILIYLTLIAGITLLLNWLLKTAPVARYWCLCWSLFLMFFMAMLAIIGPIPQWNLPGVTFSDSLSMRSDNEAVPDHDAQLTSRVNHFGERINTFGPVSKSETEMTIPGGSPAGSTLSTLLEGQNIQSAQSDRLPLPAEPESHSNMSFLNSVVRNSMPPIIAAWLGGMVLLLGRTAFGWCRLKSVLHGANPNSSKQITLALMDARRCLNYPRIPTVVISARVASPFATGLWRHFIVLPVGMVDPLSRNQLRDIFIHEMAHILRKDQAIVLLQNLAAALFWIHPLVKPVNVRLARAREEICDNYVLAATDAPAYSRTLLALAELIRPTRAWPGTVGLLTSRWKLETRVAGILDERRNRRTTLTAYEKSKVTSMMLVTCLIAGLATVAPVAGQNAEDNGNSRYTAPGVSNNLPTQGATDSVAAQPNSQPASDGAGGQNDVLERLKKAAAAAERSQQAVKSAHIRFNLTANGGPFKASATPQHCAELLAKHDLVNHPETLREILNDIYDIATPEQIGWSEMELHVRSDDKGETFVRETRHRPNGEPDVHVLSGDESIRWDDANSQMNVDKSSDNRYGVSSLYDFRTGIGPFTSIANAEVESNIVEGRKILHIRAKEGARELSVDEESGFRLRDEGKRGTSFHIRQWLGWTESQSGIRFPRVVIDLNFADAKLRMAKFLIVRETTFNIPMEDTVFKLGAPAGSVIVDSRGHRNAIMINRDVFDVSSVDEVEKAQKPLQQGFTETEQDAFAELRRLYVLKADEVIKRFGPPFPLSRKYLPRMLEPKSASTRRPIRFDFIEWNNGKLGHSFSFNGATPTLSDLISGVLKQPLTDVDIPSSLLGRKLPGDFIFRRDVSREKMADSISAILSSDLGRNVTLSFRDTEKKVYVAKGKLEINQSKVSKYGERPSIAINSGAHNGNHGESIGFGDLARLLRQLSDYTGIKIVDETEHSKEQLAWSSRWYDLPDTRAEKRFRIEPTTVLALVQEQTGIRFVEENRQVSILTLKEN